MKARGPAAFAVAAVGLLAAGSFAVQAAQPRALVVVARHDLRAGQRLTAADVTVSAVPDGGSHSHQLLPASLIGLIPGEIVSRPVIAGGAVLVPDIRPATVHAAPLPTTAGLTCGN